MRKECIMEKDQANNNREETLGGRIPENNPSKPMDSKREVENSEDQKIDQDFPGYPHYPAREDIMDQRNDFVREDVDVENLPNSRNATGVSQRYAPEQNDETFSQAMPADDDEDLDFKPGTEADVSPDEVKALEDVNYTHTRDEQNLRNARLDNTDFDGDELNEGSFGDQLSDVDLDIPDSADETSTTAMGQGDEENKYYSLGGDRHESQEEDPYSGPNSDNY
jgi:hypothetical protein